MVINKISKIRSKEIGLLSKQNQYKSFINLIAIFVPLISPIIVFIIYNYLFDDFSSSKVYTVITLLNIISDPLRTKAGVLNSYADFKNGINRIKVFLNSEEK